MDLLNEFGSKLEDAGLLTEEQEKKLKECNETFLSCEGRKSSCKDANNINVPSSERLGPSCTYSKEIHAESSDIPNEDSLIYSPSDEVQRSRIVFIDSYQKKPYNNKKIEQSTFSRNQQIVDFVKGGFKQNTYSHSFSDVSSFDKEMSEMQRPLFQQTNNTHKDKEPCLVEGFSVSNSSVDSPVKDICQTVNTSVSLFDDSYDSDTDIKGSSVPDITKSLGQNHEKIEEYRDFLSESSQNFDESQNNSKMQSSSPKILSDFRPSTFSESFRQNNLLKTISSSENTSNGTNKEYTLSAKRYHDGRVKLDIDISRSFRLSLNPITCRMSCEFEQYDLPHNTSDLTKDSHSPSTVLDESSISREVGSRDCSVNKSQVKRLKLSDKNVSAETEGSVSNPFNNISDDLNLFEKGTESNHSQRNKCKKGKFIHVSKSLPKYISKGRKRSILNSQFDSQEIRNKTIPSSKLSTPFQKESTVFLNKTLPVSSIKENCSEISYSNENSSVQNLHSPNKALFQNGVESNSVLKSSVFENRKSITSQNLHFIDKEICTPSCGIQASQKEFSSMESSYFSSKRPLKKKNRICNSKISHTLSVIEKEKLSSKFDKSIKKIVNKRRKEVNNKSEEKIRSPSMIIKKNKYLKSYRNQKLKKILRRCIRKNTPAQYISKKYFINSKKIYTNKSKRNFKNKSIPVDVLVSCNNLVNSRTNSAVKKTPKKSLIIKSKEKADSCKVISNPNKNQTCKIFEVDKMQPEVLLKPLKDPLLYNEMPSKILQNCNKSVKKITPSFKKETCKGMITLKQCSVLLEKIKVPALLNGENSLEGVQTLDKMSDVEDNDFSAFREQSSIYTNNSEIVEQDNITEDATNNASKCITFAGCENQKLIDYDAILTNEAHNHYLSEGRKNKSVSRNSSIYNNTVHNKKEILLDFDIDFDSDVELASPDNNNTNLNYNKDEACDDSQMKLWQEKENSKKISKKENFNSSEISKDVLTASYTDFPCGKKIKDRQKDLLLDFDIDFESNMRLHSDESNGVIQSGSQIETFETPIATENTVSNFSKTDINNIKTSKNNMTQSDESLNFPRSLFLDFDTDSECIINLASPESNSVEVNNSGDTCNVSLSEYLKDILVKDSKTRNAKINLSRKNANQKFKSNLTSNKSISVSKNLCLNCDSSSDTDLKLISDEDNSIAKINFSRKNAKVFTFKSNLSSNKSISISKNLCLDCDSSSDSDLELISDRDNTINLISKDLEKNKFESNGKNTCLNYSDHSDGIVEFFSEGDNSVCLNDEMNRACQNSKIKPCQSENNGGEKLEFLNVPLEEKSSETCHEMGKEIPLVYLEQLDLKKILKPCFVLLKKIEIPLESRVENIEKKNENVISVAELEHKSGIMIEEEVLVETRILKNYQKDQVGDMNIFVGSNGNSTTIPDNQICALDGEISNQGEKLPLYFDTESDDLELIIDEDFDENIDRSIGNEPKSTIPIEDKICYFGNKADFFITSENRNGVIINDENIICDDIYSNENNYYSLNSNFDDLKLITENSLNKENSVNGDFQCNVKDHTSNSDYVSESLIPRGIASNANEEFLVIRKNTVDIENTSNISPEINQISFVEKNKSFKKNIIPKTAEIPEAQVISKMKLNDTSKKCIQNKNIINNSDIMISKSNVNNSNKKCSKMTSEKEKFQNYIINKIKNKYLKKAKNRHVFSDPISNILYGIERIKISSASNKQNLHLFITNLCVKNHVTTLVAHLLNPIAIPDQASLIFQVLYYLHHTRENPFLNFKKNSELPLFLPLAESCVVTALFDIKKKAKPYLHGLIENILRIMHLLILTKKKINIYGLASLCRVFTEICKRDEDELKPLSLCCALINEKHKFSPFLIASVAGVWKELFLLSDDFSDKENILRGSIAYGVQKMMETSVACSWYCNLEFMSEYFSIPSNISDKNGTIKILKEKILSECFHDSTENSWKLTSPLIIFAAFETWNWTKEHLVDKYILPNLQQFSCQNISEQAFNLFFNLYVDILLLYPDRLPDEVLMKYLDTNLSLQGGHFVQDCAAVALMKYFVLTRKTIPDNISFWFQNNQDNPKVKVFEDIFQKSLMLDSCDTFSNKDIVNLC
ncbi:uncharacterized protein TNCT_273642 [Trichonephila clavata]|uniref:Uncharacterized protein n=1 Tax=Trichonephila clavata TaxID=2740835 RepID=A0A8X6KTW2_TRICU|nr:uncharacterized protein TNCT_273642 [Trichonephila clavata]